MYLLSACKFAVLRAACLVHKEPSALSDSTNGYKSHVIHFRLSLPLGREPYRVNTTLVA